MKKRDVDRVAGGPLDRRVALGAVRLLEREDQERRLQVGDPERLRPALWIAELDSALFASLFGVKIKSADCKSAIRNGQRGFPTWMRRSRERSESASCRTHATRKLNAWVGEFSRSPGGLHSITD